MYSERQRGVWGRTVWPICIIRQVNVCSPFHSTKRRLSFFFSQCNRSSTNQHSLTLFLIRLIPPFSSFLLSLCVTVLRSLYVVYGKCTYVSVVWLEIGWQNGRKRSCKRRKQRKTFVKNPFPLFSPPPPLSQEASPQFEKKEIPFFYCSFSFFFF